MSCSAQKPMMGGRRRHSKRHSKKQRGGDSAWQSVMSAVGSGNTQWQNVFGPDSRAMGNGITHANGTPNTNMSLKLSGGRRRRRGKKGGDLVSTLGTAVVPFGLLALNQTYGRRGKGSKSRRTRRRR